MSLDLSKLDIPADTLRRLRYATFESIDEHGRTTFTHDPGISEGRLSSLSVDRGTGHISETMLRQEQAASSREAGSRAPEPAPQPRDAAGRFTSEES